MSALNSAIRDTRVFLLQGGKSPERDISLLSARERRKLEGKSKVLFFFAFDVVDVEDDCTAPVIEPPPPRLPSLAMLACCCSGYPVGG